MDLGVRWAGMAFGWLVCSVGVMVVVVGVGILWGPGRDLTLSESRPGETSVGRF